MTNELIEGFLARGCLVDVLVIKQRGGHFAALPDDARIWYLRTAHARLAVSELADYLARWRPPVLLAVKDRAGRTAIRAARRVGTDTRVFIRIGNNLSQTLSDKGRMQRALRYRSARRDYPLADGIVAISRGVAEDVITTAEVDPARVHVAPNPVINAALLRRGAERPAHEWLRVKEKPVLIAVGRLTEQKDFATLLRGFAHLRRTRDARLIIVGEGEKRAELENLVTILGIGEHVDLPGFANNPYSLMSHSDVLVLSSAWEGFGNVLVEALALGTPVVATDCRSGPREILDDGRYGRLVAVGDSQGLCTAMAHTLDALHDRRVLRQGVRPYTSARSIRRYGEILGLACVRT